MSGPAWSRELSDRLDDRRELLVMSAHTGFQFLKFSGKGLVVENQAPQGDKSAHHDQAHLHRPRAVYHGCGHESSMFREGEGRVSTAATTFVWESLLG